MKKALSIAMTLALSVGILTACGSGESAATPTPATPTPASTPTIPAAEGDYEDGVYYAEGADFAESSGWKETVTLRVENGNIIAVNWSGLHRDGGLEKKEYSVQGKYAMVERSNAVLEWHEQAELAEAYLLEQQDPALVTYDDGGYTDAIAGVSIHINGLVDLAAEALAAGPVEEGPYTDGVYYAEEAEFTGSWKGTLDLTIQNGHIFSVYWSGIHQEGGTDKATRSRDGEYGMVERGGAIAEWHEQAYLTEQTLLETQDPDAPELAYDEGGYPDAIAGVSVHINDFIALVKDALEQAQ